MHGGPAAWVDRFVFGIVCAAALRGRLVGHVGIGIGHIGEARGETVFGVKSARAVDAALHANKARMHDGRTAAVQRVAAILGVVVEVAIVDVDRADRDNVRVRTSEVCRSRAACVGSIITSGDGDMDASIRSSGDDFID